MTENTTTTLCLVMIVKDEEKVIEECLSSVSPFIDYWIICDTGSSDNTPQLVKEFFDQKGILGELHHHKWQDFAYNRSQALTLAREKATYSLMMDADDLLLEGGIDKSLLNADSYLMQMELGPQCRFWRTQLFRNDKVWVYRGVIHEYPACETAYTQEKYPGDCIIQARSCGARSANPNKYLDDAAVLLQALEKEPSNTRYVFYLAQSYRDSKQPELALKYYCQRAAMGGWPEEVYYSLYMIAFIKQYSLGKPWSECLEDYLTAFNYRPSRVEPLYQIVRFYRLEGKFDKAMIYGKQALEVLNNGSNDILFLDSSVYQWCLFDEVSIAATYENDAELALQLYDRLLNEGFVPEADLPRIKKNLTFVNSAPTNITQGTKNNQAQVKSENQLIKEARHLYKCCPLCESSNIIFLREADCRTHPLYNSILPGTISWKQCHSCGHSFTDGYFTAEALDILFHKANDHQLLTVDKMEQARAVAATIVDKISSILSKQEGKWLDIGFGNGALLLTCAEYGFEPVGIDLRKEAVEKVKPLGIEAYCQELVDFEQFGNFTVISMADVLEHMPYPKKALARAYKLLAPGGVLFVSCPNADSVVWKSLTESQINPYWGEIEHYHNFGRQRLYELLTEHGFEPVNYGISKRYRVGMEVISKKKF